MLNPAFLAVGFDYYIQMVEQLSDEDLVKYHDFMFDALSIRHRIKEIHKILKGEKE